MPSLYLWHEGLGAGIDRYVDAMVAESRRLARRGQAVVPFVWPEFHTHSSLADQYIGYADFHRLLSRVQQKADGVILWGRSVMTDPHRDTDWYRAVVDVFGTSE